MVRTIKKKGGRAESSFRLTTLVFSIADEIFKMLLSFPVDNSVSEIIQDIIYANSTSMDGRRFADEFMKRRRVDMANNMKTPSSALSASASAPAIASVEDDSFQVVNKKGKKVKPL